MVIRQAWCKRKFIGGREEDLEMVEAGKMGEKGRKREREEERNKRKRGREEKRGRKKRGWPGICGDRERENE